MEKIHEDLEILLLKYKLKEAKKIELRINGLENELKENVPKIRKAGLYAMILGAVISFAGYCSLIYNANNTREEKTVKEFFYDSKKDLPLLFGGLAFAVLSWTSEYAAERAYKKQKFKEIKKEEDYGFGGLSGYSN
ncbi:hypothetical protein HYX16_02485 [Candidatus Woesearchaeota archaeon]|nr:hypothetical protein [Candidatus Woesearchaeota archaeon]